MSRRRKIQLLLWTYFWLLIFEGALRKWVLPGLSTPLLVVRDPVALAALMLGMPALLRGPWRGWVLWFCGLGIIAFSLALLVGHRDVPTALFGTRIWVLHLPLVFLYATAFTRDDVWKFVRWTALVAIPMTMLIVMQYSLPQSHILNVAPGGEEGGGFSGAMGRFRPPGTFSFTSGLTEFCSLAAAGVGAWLLCGPRPLPMWLWGSMGALLVALPVSISRSLLFKYMLVVASAMVAALLGRRQVKWFLVGVAAVAVLGAVLSHMPVVEDAVTVFQYRWDTATENEGEGRGVQGVLEARLGDFTVGYYNQAFEYPILGHGIGMGTHVGALRLFGKRKAAIAEGVWGATLGELGPAIGTVALGLRVIMALWLLKLAWAQARRGNALPMLLASFSLPLVVLGQTSQPTGLGFIVLGAGLTLAACNMTNAELLRRRSRRAAEAQVASSGMGRKLPQATARSFIDTPLSPRAL